MKISVITVCYNSAKTMERALRSVSEQDYQHVEHIVIDGGSSDGSADILAAYRSRLAHLVCEPDHGIYDAMNKGLALARGEVICFLNADDYYASPKVLSQVARKMRGQKLDALIGDVGYFREKAPQRIVRRYRSDRFTPERLAWGWMPAHPALFLSRKVVQRVGKFKTDYRIAGDFEFIIRAFHGHTLHYEHIPEILVHMQTGGASTGGWSSKVLLNREVLRACRENGLQTHMLKILSKYPAKLMEIMRPYKHGG
ncbi:MAG TPA: glycosyltransferase family 2 protein [Rhodocyclaceae bacterium]|jgi:glycosyltransferase involved in cell wall biosynthesis